MRDIKLESCVMDIDGMPGGTHKVMFVYDTRGWAIRCYDEDGNKLTTMIPDPGVSEYSNGSIKLVRRELV